MTSELTPCSMWRPGVYLPCNPVEVECKEEGLASESGRGKCCLTARMARTHHDDVIVLLVIPQLGLCKQSFGKLMYAQEKQNLRLVRNHALQCLHERVAGIPRCGSYLVGAIAVGGDC